MISEVLQWYFPNWEVHEDNYQEWQQCYCPAHDDSSPSASISFDHDAFNCFACGYKGDYLAIIMREEECDFPTAIRIAEGIAEASGIEVPQPAKRKRRRGVSRPARFGESRRDRKVQTRVRRRPFT